MSDNQDFHYTPSGRLAPYPNMSDDDLDAFEAWAEALHEDARAKALMILFALVLILSYSIIYFLQ